MFPMPMELPAFTEEQRLYSEYLRGCVLVNDIYVGPARFQELVKLAKAAQSGMKHEIKRQLTLILMTLALIQSVSL